MVKEIEVKNNTEQLEAYLQLTDFENYPEIVTGVLTSNGTIMTVKVNRLLKPNSFRKVVLYYMIPSYEIQQVAEYELGTFGPSDTVDETEEYVFDLSPVLTTIVHQAPEQLVDDTISVRLFTYEANITTDYGSKTLHVPYTLSYPGSMITPASTDGWYALHVIDVMGYSGVFHYDVNDIIWYTDGFYKCIVSCTGVLPTDITKWTPVTSEGEHNLYEFGYETCSTIATLLNTDILVTRYIKQKYIYELLIKTNYKRYDNIAVVTQAEKISSMREAAIVHLNAGNPIQARYLLDMIILEISSFMNNNGERRVVEMITNFTI